ncbi:phosphoglycolate phosphatase [Nitratireductor sp. CAU 1489]|uniref:Phosphoglycolate phosphatase n=1 Tax=Nitratireductor arenosus TaxID=2682096 RepID=A0A844QEK4_9HYPH|nr:phosphoglycolate phosphatase [Nitratireductor arenosus]MVA97752.1 phosphoglycolate phosphatase [Nitratireductor arenosus]
MKRPSPVIVFDLDGTLIDTAPDLIASLNHALADHGLAPVSPASMRAFAGLGGKAMIERVHAERRVRLEPETSALMVETFLAHYGDTIPGTSLPYHGATPALERLAAAGFALAICTNKPQAMTERLLEALKLTAYFSAVCGADRFSFRKPDPRHLTETIALAGADPRRAVMIGDSRNDVATAKAAGIPVVAVEHGYSDIPVRALEPSRVISHFDELTAELAQRLIDGTLDG